MFHMKRPASTMQGVSYGTTVIFCKSSFSVYHRDMLEIVYAVALYIGVFSVDYLYYHTQKGHYRYVSRRTYFLFILAQLATFGLFYNHFATHTTFLITELLFVSIFAGALLLFARQLTKEKVYVCNLIERTYRCVTPYYVWVKGAEIMFQQMVYMVIAHQIMSILGVNVFTYILFVLITIFMHMVIVFGCTPAVRKRLTVGAAVLAVPSFYIFTSLDLLWPAVYLHGIFYVAYWLAYADFDTTTQQKQKVDKRG